MLQSRIVTRAKSWLASNFKIRTSYHVEIYLYHILYISTQTVFFQDYTYGEDSQHIDTVISHHAVITGYKGYYHGSYEF